MGRRPHSKHPVEAGQRRVRGRAPEGDSNRGTRSAGERRSCASTNGRSVEEPSGDTTIALTNAPQSNLPMADRECYHCKQWIAEGQEHDCWTTTEAALTLDLSEELRDAWERVRETAVSFGDQRIYASHNSIMFSRQSCYFFVRPKKNFLEVCMFLGRILKAPQVRRTMPASR